MISFQEKAFKDIRSNFEEFFFPIKDFALFETRCRSDIMWKVVSLWNQHWNRSEASAENEYF